MTGKNDKTGFFLLATPRGGAGSLSQPLGVGLLIFFLVVDSWGIRDCVFM